MYQHISIVWVLHDHDGSIECSDPPGLPLQQGTKNGGFLWSIGKRVAHPSKDINDGGNAGDPRNERSIEQLLHSNMLDNLRTDSAMDLHQFKNVINSLSEFRLPFAS